MCEQSLYFVIHLYLVILVGVFCCILSNLPQYPGVVSGARRCYWLAVNQGVRVLSLTTVREVRFADLAILRAQSGEFYDVPVSEMRNQKLQTQLRLAHVKEGQEEIRKKLCRLYGCF